MMNEKIDSNAVVPMYTEEKYFDPEEYQVPAGHVIRLEPNPSFQFGMVQTENGLIPLTVKEFKGKMYTAPYPKGSYWTITFADRALLSDNDREQLKKQSFLCDEMWNLRMKREKEEAEKKAREEAEKKAREEAEQKAQEEAEKKAREEAEQKAQEEAEQKATGSVELPEMETPEEAEPECIEPQIRKDGPGDYCDPGTRVAV